MQTKRKKVLIPGIGLQPPQYERSVDLTKVRLGKKAVRHDKRTLQMRRYLPPIIAAPPPQINYGHHIPYLGMMLNDQLGDCTIAAVGHTVQTWTTNTQANEVSITDAEVLSYYEKWAGYNPNDPSTDQGAVELDILNQWRQQGFVGQPLDAYMAVHLGNENSNNLIQKDIMIGIWLFGGVYIGLNMPIRAQRQQVWNVPVNHTSQIDQPGSWGGHAIFLTGYTPKTVTGITWGYLQMMTWGWLDYYCNEAYALVSKDWMGRSGVSHSGFDWATLNKDLGMVTA